MSKVYAKIEQLCSQHNISVNSLARSTKISRNTVNSWKKEERDINLSSIKHIVDFFNISLADFFENFNNAELTKTQYDFLFAIKSLGATEKDFISQVINTFISIKT